MPRLFIQNSNRFNQLILFERNVLDMLQAKSMYAKDLDNNP